MRNADNGWKDVSQYACEGLRRKRFAHWNLTSVYIVRNTYGTVTDVDGHGYVKLFTFHHHGIGLVRHFQSLTPRDNNDRGSSGRLIWFIAGLNIYGKCIPDSDGNETGRAVQWDEGKVAGLLIAQGMHAVMEGHLIEVRPTAH